MFFRKKQKWELPESAVTPETAWQSRRRFIQGMAAAGVVGGMAAPAIRWLGKNGIAPAPAIHGATTNEGYGPPGRSQTPARIALTYNNFYEFSFSKQVSDTRCRDFRLDPWTLLIDGRVKKPAQIGLEDILKMPLEQRVYRLRCVEAWAMTIPWIGLPLSALLQKVEPLADARFVSIESFYDPQQAPRQKLYLRMPWPYRETLTIAEAMHPLTFAAVGMYGAQLRPQSGAPFRVVIPWKYGFKGAKSVVRIQFTTHAAPTFWNTLQPDEYDTVANVDPDKPHPRWSQKTEVLLGEWGKRIPTVKYNGYGEWVRALYERPGGGGQ
jgi:sulfoxide reductase catalytic subunit YedY